MVLPSQFPLIVHSFISCNRPFSSIYCIRTSVHNFVFSVCLCHCVTVCECVPLYINTDCVHLSCAFRRETMSQWPCDQSCSWPTLHELFCCAVIQLCIQLQALQYCCGCTASYHIAHPNECVASSTTCTRIIPSRTFISFKSTQRSFQIHQSFKDEVCDSIEDFEKEQQHQMVIL